MVSVIARDTDDDNLESSGFIHLLQIFNSAFLHNRFLYQHRFNNTYSVIFRVSLQKVMQK